MPGGEELATVGSWHGAVIFRTKVAIFGMDRPPPKATKSQTDISDQDKRELEQAGQLKDPITAEKENQTVTDQKP